jgi:serine/threonine-protein kinase
MGEVLLVQDQDIARPVAIKRLLPAMTDTDALLRFVEEIRTIGQLEHPNIVPIHDVGVDEEGRYFFVMKYVEGETLAVVLERLRAGDPDYHRHYTFERRVEIFLGVLRALAFAHARGILHRDIKPANVMVGRFGEVVVMDWGIAKAYQHERHEPASPAPSSAPGQEGGAERLLATRAGAYVGTPSYMSPEQALGKNDALDPRSDLYSATVLLHELVTLRHYLGERPSVEATLAAVVGEDIPVRRLFGERHPHQAPPPAELIYTLAKGLQKDPAKRFQSAGEMMDELQDVLEGRAAIRCQVTLTKRMLREMGRFVDRHPGLAVLAMVAVAASVLFTGVSLVQAVLV